MVEEIVEGKRRLKVRRASPTTFTKARTAMFLATLAETCNVVRAAKAAGVSANYAYRRRKTDATFRSGWAAAIAEGYAKLELVLLDRALNGKIKVVRGASGGKDARIREYSDTLALTSGLTAVFRTGAWELGTLRGEKVEIDGQQVVGAREAAIPAPTAGSVVDVQARTAVSAILTALRQHGLIAP